MRATPALLVLAIAGPVLAQPPRGDRPPRPGTILPGTVRDRLALTDEQRVQLDALQKEASERLDSLLTPEQKGKIRDTRPARPEAGTTPPPPVAVRAVADTPANVRAAVGRAIPQLLSAADGSSAERSCYTCHQHAVPLLALTVARNRGFAVPEKERVGIAEFIAADMRDHRRREQRGGRQPQPGGVEADVDGYALFGLDAGGYAPDRTTAATAKGLLGMAVGDHWQPPVRRPPHEGSAFTATAAAVRGLKRYGDPGKVEQQIAAALGWLVKTPPRDTEDRVFRLLGLKAAGAKADDVTSAAKELLATQRADGGWGQLESMPSDAYATGSALFALHDAGGLAADAPAYRNGVRFLLGTQGDDGTWHVRTRSRPAQRYFETGFPHGTDQFISCAATGWATAALAVTAPTTAK